MLPHLVPAIDFVLRQARVEPEELGAIAVDVGPGLFTGLRVGLATGKALASALGVPMVGLSSLVETPYGTYLFYNGNGYGATGFGVAIAEDP